MSDELPDGSFRGWADLLATRLNARSPEFRYANLAIRGKLAGQIADEQAPLAAAMGADLVSFAGGVNDLLRPSCDIDAVCSRVERTAELLADGSGRLLLFRAIDPSRRMRGSSRFMARLARLISLVTELGERHDAIVVDLFAARIFDDPRLWAADRIHLNTEGHRPVADAVAEALRLPGTSDWSARLSPAQPASWPRRRAADLTWARSHALPWVGRRLTGRSSGDGRAAKQPLLTPLKAPGADGRE